MCGSSSFSAACSKMAGDQVFDATGLAMLRNRTPMADGIWTAHVAPMQVANVSVKHRSTFGDDTSRARSESSIAPLECPRRLCVRDQPDSTGYVSASSCLQRILWPGQLIETALGSWLHKLQRAMVTWIGSRISWTFFGMISTHAEKMPSLHRSLDGIGHWFPSQNPEGCEKASKRPSSAPTASEVCSLPIRLSPTPTICSVSPWTAGKGRRRRIEEAIRLILDCSENRTGV